MIKFPESTEFNKRIPKQKFYDNLNVSSGLKEQFIKEIDTIYWKNKLSKDTLNVNPGDLVIEIEVFEVKLKDKNISKNIIYAIDREIPYHIVFVMRYDNQAQVWISYKEDSKSKEGKFKVDSYYNTDWKNHEDLTLELEGLNLDKIYENFILQVLNGKLNLANGVEFKKVLENAKEKERLSAQIKKLEKQIRNEKQFNRQVKLMGELRNAKEMFEKL